MKAGSKQSVTVSGGAMHNGGSCQISISLDDGKSFTAIHSYIGGCPSGNPLSFRVPSDTPASGEALLSWSWMNKVGNREFYQNCAPIMIEGGDSGGEDVPFDQRPAMFTANLGNGCETAPSADVMIPDPGPDVDMNNPDAVAPVGSCGGSGSSYPGASGGQEPPSHGSADQPANPGLAAAECTCASGGWGDEGPLSFLNEGTSIGVPNIVGQIVAIFLAVAIPLLF